MDGDVVKITIPKFSEFIRIANKRSVKPFEKSSKTKLPKKYQTEDYKWNEKGYLVDAVTGIVVPKNPRMAGQPRDWRINGQDVYNQKVTHNGRNAVATKMHEKFKDDLNKIDHINEDLYPLTMRLNFYILDQNKIKDKTKNIDNDNRWIYEKFIQDTLVELGKIPDDNPYYINGNFKKTYFVEDPEDVKLEIILTSNE